MVAGCPQGGKPSAPHFLSPHSLAHLEIFRPRLPVGHKVNLPVPHIAHKDLVATAQQLQVDHVLQQKAPVSELVAKEVEPFSF